MTGCTFYASKNYSWVSLRHTKDAYKCKYMQHVVPLQYINLHKYVCVFFIKNFKYPETANGLQ